MSDDDFDGVIKAYREALQAFVQGDPKPVLEHFCGVTT